MNNRILRIGIWSLVLIALDQISKYLISTYVPDSTNLFGNLLRIEYTQNTGIAFGIPVPYTILVVGNVILLGLIVWVINKEFDLDQPLAKTGLILIISGAFGNIIDRLIHGYVIDFIAVWSWPNFNFADAYISVGILIMILFYGKIKRSNSRSSNL